MKLQFTNQTSTSLESDLERLALEGMFVDNLIDVFDSAMNKVRAKFVDMSALLNTNVNTITAKELHKEEILLKNSMKDITFSEISDTLALVPYNFSGPLQPYVNLLSVLNKNIITETNKVVSSYNFMISRFISDSTTRVSLDDNAAYMSKTTKALEGLTAELNKFHDPDSTKDKAKIGTLVERVADLPALAKSSVNLAKLIDDKALSELSQSVKQVSEMLDLVLKRIKDKSIDAVSGEAGKIIAEGAYLTAKYVELVSLTRYRTDQLLLSVNDVLNKVNNRPD